MKKDSEQGLKIKRKPVSRETLKPKDWHAWVYGGQRNPHLDIKWKTDYNADFDTER